MPSVPGPAHPLAPPSSRLAHNVIPIARPRNPLDLWHLLSLDAPSVAALWTYFLASANHLHLQLTSIAAMATAVWLLYAADRLLDARLLDVRLLDARANSHEDLEARHRFHHRHRIRFHFGTAAASLVLAVLLPFLPPEAIRLYLIEASFLTAYFLLIHAAPTPFRLPKELAVGLFFAAAVFIPTVARAPSLRLPLLAPAALFAALCTLNCLYIYTWEHPGPTHPSAHSTTQYALRHLRALSLTLLLTALALTALSRSTIPAAIALATAFLLALHAFRRSLTSTTLRAAADLVLLTPLLFLPFR